MANPLIMEHIRGTRLFKLYQHFCYKDIVVPAGFITDGASIPRIFWSLIGGPYDKYLEAAVVHDFMCRNPQLYHRKEADDTFLEIMKELGVKEWRRDAMWRVVSLLQNGDVRKVGEIKTLGD